MLKKDKLLDEDKVISVRLKGIPLGIFNSLDISPTDFFNYALKNYIEDSNLSEEKIMLLAGIQSTIIDIHNLKISLREKEDTLRDLRGKLESLEDNEYYRFKSLVLPELEEHYQKCVVDGSVDNVEDYLSEYKYFFRSVQMKYGVSREIMNGIMEDFYRCQIIDGLGGVSAFDILDGDVFSNHYLSE